MNHLSNIFRMLKTAKIMVFGVVFACVFSGDLCAGGCSEKPYGPVENWFDRSSGDTNRHYHCGAGYCGTGDVIITKDASGLMLEAYAECHADTDGGKDNSRWTDLKMSPCDDVPDETMYAKKRVDNAAIEVYINGVEMDGISISIDSTPDICFLYKCKLGNKLSVNGNYCEKCTEGATETVPCPDNYRNVATCKKVCEGGRWSAVSIDECAEGYTYKQATNCVVCGVLSTKPIDCRPDQEHATSCKQGCNQGQWSGFSTIDACEAGWYVDERLNKCVDRPVNSCVKGATRDVVCPRDYGLATQCEQVCTEDGTWGGMRIVQCVDGYEVEGGGTRCAVTGNCTTQSEKERLNAVDIEMSGNLCVAKTCKQNYYKVKNNNAYQGWCNYISCPADQEPNIDAQGMWDQTTDKCRAKSTSTVAVDPAKTVVEETGGTEETSDDTAEASVATTVVPEQTPEPCEDTNQGIQSGHMENGICVPESCGTPYWTLINGKCVHADGAPVQQGSETVAGGSNADAEQAKTDVKPTVTLTTEQSSALAVAATAAGAIGTEKQQLAEEQVKNLVDANTALQEQGGNTEGLTKQQLETFDSAVTELESNDGDVSKLTADQKDALVAVAEKYGKSSQTGTVTEATVEVVTEGEGTVKTDENDETDADAKAEAEAAYEEAKEKYNKAKETEQSTANKMLGTVGMGATGVGGAMLMSGLAEQNADADAERAMQAYLATFTCKFGNTSVQGGEKEVVIPGGNELIGLYGEYVALANDLKIRKTALGMKPGIESEPILESATSGLYDDVSTGKTSGAYASLARALMDPNGEDAKKWNEQRDKTQENIKTGGITAASGAGISLVGDITNKAVEKKKAEAAEKKAKEEASAN